MSTQDVVLDGRLSQVTLQVRVSKRFQVRTWLAIRLAGLAAWVGGWSLDVKEDA